MCRLNKVWQIHCTNFNASKNSLFFSIRIAKDLILDIMIIKHTRWLQPKKRFVNSQIMEHMTNIKHMKRYYKGNIKVYKTKAGYSYIIVTHKCRGKSILHLQLINIFKLSTAMRFMLQQNFIERFLKHLGNFL